LNLATAGFLCLIVIVLLSLFGSLISGAILSIAAIGALDFFFAPPLLSLRISDPINILALLTFLTTTLVITYLMTRLRREKDVSEIQRKEVKRLYELAQQLLALTPEEADPPRLLELFRDAFRLQAVCLVEAESGASNLSGKSHHKLEAWTKVGHKAERDLDDFERKISVRNLRVGGQLIGVLGLEGLAHQDVTTNALAALATAMLERTRIFRTATHAAAAAQAENLRGTLLDALAHAVKTPLATILAAVGGLRATGNLTLNHLDFVDVVELEAGHLDRLTSRLLRMANLDREEVSLQLQPVDLSTLIADEIKLKSQQFADHNLSLVNEKGTHKKHVDVEADPELLSLALAQLIENACKYSQPGSKIEVSADTDEDSVAIRVRNGSYIPPEERTKIFDRFYRGKQLCQSTSGTGLGLDIARRIAMAHGGTLVLEESSKDGSIFRITVPVSVRAR